MEEATQGAPLEHCPRCWFRRSFLLLATTAALLALWKYPTHTYGDTRMAMKGRLVKNFTSKRLAVVTSCLGVEKVAMYTNSLNREYCEKYGCTFVVAKDKWNLNGVERIKLRSLNMTASEKFDFLWWLDCDAAFVDHELSPQHLLSHFSNDNVGIVLSRHYDHETHKIRKQCAIPQSAPVLWPWGPKPGTKQYPRWIDDGCGVNGGSFIIRNNHVGKQAYQLLMAHQEICDEQSSFNAFVTELVNTGHQHMAKFVYSSGLNRHLPPIGYPEQDEMTEELFTGSGVWSSSPTLVVHPWGQTNDRRISFWECANRTFPRDGHKVIDKCALAFRREQ